MGRFKSNALVLRHRRSPRNEYDSGRLSGSLAAFTFAIYPGIKNPRSDSFRKECTPRPLLLFQKMRGWLRGRHAIPPARTQMRPNMRYFPITVVLIGAAMLGGCNGGVLDPHGPIAEAERQIMLNSTGIMLAIVIPTILATLGVAYWFRASNERARYLPDFDYSGRLEVLVWSIPLMTVLLLGGVTWVGSFDLDPPKPIAAAGKPVRVQVVALDWKWLFIYPDQGVASVNHLTVPVGTAISFELTSSGVMNSFLVPQLGGQIYTMAGMVTRLNLRADHV